MAPDHGPLLGIQLELNDDVVNLQKREKKMKRKREKKNEKKDREEPAKRETEPRVTCLVQLVSLLFSFCSAEMVLECSIRHSF